jgi:hypothetical protein
MRIRITASIFQYFSSVQGNTNSWLMLRPIVSTAQSVPVSTPRNRFLILSKGKKMTKSNNGGINTINNQNLIGLQYCISRIYITHIIDSDRNSYISVLPVLAWWKWEIILPLFKKYIYLNTGQNKKMTAHPAMCIFECLLRLDKRGYDLEHTEQLKCFPPQWAGTWFLRPAEWVKDLLHTEQVNGFSPEWTLKCSLRFPANENDFWQTEHV